MVLGSSQTDSLLRDIRDALRKLVTSQDNVGKSLKKFESILTHQNFTPSPANENWSTTIPVKLDWDQSSPIVGSARISDDGTLVSIRVMLNVTESDKVREAMRIAPVEALLIQSVVPR